MELFFWLAVSSLIIRGIDILSGQVTPSKLCCLPSEMESPLKGKNLLSSGAKFFPFRADPFSDGDLCAGKLT